MDWTGCPVNKKEWCGTRTRGHRVKGMGSVNIALKPGGGKRGIGEGWKSSNLGWGIAQLNLGKRQKSTSTRTRGRGMCDL